MQHVEGRRLEGSRGIVVSFPARGPSSLRDLAIASHLDRAGMDGIRDP